LHICGEEPWVNEQPGLKEIESILTDIESVAFIRLSSRDVVRHKLVQDIINAYVNHEAHKSGQSSREIQENSK
jgi:phosphate starvation-inducible PhoH-like protein